MKEKFKKFDKLPKGYNYFMKKPISIKAIQLKKPFEVETLEADNQKGKAGDYLIKGVKGELYPCDKEIFKESYSLSTFKGEHYYPTLKTRKKHIFWGCIFKAGIIGGLYGLNRYIIHYAKPDIKTASRYEEIPSILEEIANLKKWNLITRCYVKWFGNILKYFLTIDTAYADLFDEFIKEYHKRNFKK